METLFDLQSGTAGIPIVQLTAGVTEGLQVRWDQLADDIFNLDLTLQQPTNGVLQSIRVGNAAPGTTSGLLNVTKLINLSWPGGGAAVLSDPLGEITSHADGAVIFSGTPILLDSGTALIDSRCCLLYTSPSPRDQRGSRMPSSA